VAGVRRVFLIFAILGALAPLALTIVFVSEHGLDFGEIADQVFAGAMSTLVLIDLTISSLIGLCFALPLYLYRRSSALQRPAQS
jgi:hypothetical protein